LKKVEDVVLGKFAQSEMGLNNCIDYHNTLTEDVIDLALVNHKLVKDMSDVLN